MPSHCGIWDIKRINLAPGANVILDTSDWSVEWAIFSCSSGVMDIHWGYNSNPSGAPMWRFIPGDAPTYLPVVFTGDRYVLTIVNGSGAGGDQLLGSIIFCARHNKGFDYSR